MSVNPLHEQMRTPETSVMKAIREAAKIGAIIKFAEQPGIGDENDPSERYLEIRIKRPWGQAHQEISAIVNHELDVIRVIRQFVHEVT